ncbi:hypothetical protein H0H87_004122 [Tephrocybe sp. NHM501043]|nr:hypothetical protein H0H87_004122 [Tephrocybe sp. NHM501043]
MRVLVSASAVLLSVLQLSRAVDVYLSPQPSFTSSSLHHARAALSRHLGLDVLEPLHDASNPQDNDQPFVGKGSRNALLLTVDEVDAKVILPPSLQPAFNLPALSPGHADSLSSVVSTYRHRAAHIFASIYDGAARPFELEAFFETAETPSFAAIELSRLSELRNAHGLDSSEYIQAALEIRQFLASANSDVFHLAILTFSAYPPHLNKREPQLRQTSQSPLPSSHPSPQEPIGAVSTCFTSVEACTNSTNSCSGRGQCQAATKSGRTCFVCACEVTRSGEGSKVKTDIWAGQSCERKDVSGPFVLLTGTVIVLLILVFGSVSLLSSVGNVELPSVLLATAVGVKKD